MEGGRMAISAVVILVAGALMCAPSTAMEPPILTHRMVSRSIPSGWVGSTIDEPPVEHPDYESRNGRHRLFDRQQNKGWTAESRLGMNHVFVEYVFPRRTKVKKYRIIVDKAGDPQEYPRSWTLYGSKNPFVWSRAGLIPLHEVNDYHFTRKGTPLLKLSRRGNFRKYYLEITDDGNPGDGKVRVTMTEIKLMGDLSQFDDPKFPGGVYPCKKTLEILTLKNGVDRGTPFSSEGSPGFDAKGAFDWDGKGWLSAFKAVPPVIIGYEFNEFTTVQMYRVLFSAGGIIERAVRNFKFQGSFCAEGCDLLGNDGWDTLDTVRGHTYARSKSAWDKFDQFVVPDPKPYKAYRLRIVRDNYYRDFPGDITAAQVGQLILMGCTYGGVNNHIKYV